MVKVPVRNKCKDNPYTLGYDEEKKVYIVKFKDSKKEQQNIEINKDVYEAFNKFEVEDESFLYKQRRYIEYSEVFDYSLYKRAIKKEKSIYDKVEENIKNDELKKAIDKLTETQKRRIRLYYFEDKTLNEIARLEGCSIKNIYKSLELAKKNLKKNLKN